jgi:hypothetical protein
MQSIAWRPIFLVLEIILRVWFMSLPEHKTKITIYNVGNLGPGLGQAQKCGRVKPGNRIPTPFLITCFLN